MCIAAPAARAPIRISRRVGMEFSSCSKGPLVVLATPPRIGGHEGLTRPGGHRVAPAFGAPEPAFAGRAVAARDDGGLRRGGAAKRTGEGGLRLRHARASCRASSVASVSSVPCAVCRGCPWSYSFRWRTASLPRFVSRFRRPECRRLVSGEPAGFAYRPFEFRLRHQERPSCACASPPASVSWRGLAVVARRRSWVLPWSRVREDREPGV